MNAVFSLQSAVQQQKESSSCMTCSFVFICMAWHTAGHDNVVKTFTIRPVCIPPDLLQSSYAILSASSLYIIPTCLDLHLCAVQAAHAIHAVHVAAQAVLDVHEAVQTNMLHGAGSCVIQAVQGMNAVGLWGPRQDVQRAWKKCKRRASPLTARLCDTLLTSASRQAQAASHKRIDTARQECEGGQKFPT